MEKRTGPVLLETDPAALSMPDTSSGKSHVPSSKPRAHKCSYVGCTCGEYPIRTDDRAVMNRLLYR